MNEETKEKKSFLDDQHEVLCKCMNELKAEPTLLGNPKTTEFMEAVSKFEDAYSRAKQCEFSIFGEKFRTKLGLIESAVKISVVAVGLWFELTKGTIFGGFLTKEAFKTLFRKNSL